MKEQMLLFCRMYKNVRESLLSPRGDGGNGDTFVREGGFCKRYSAQIKANLG